MFDTCVSFFVFSLNATWFLWLHINQLTCFIMLNVYTAVRIKDTFQNSFFLIKYPRVFLIFNQGLLQDNLQKTRSVPTYILLVSNLHTGTIDQISLFIVTESPSIKMIPLIHVIINRLSSK